MLITGLPLSDVERTVHQIIVVEIIVAGAGLVLATAAGALIIRRTLRPLRRVAGHRGPGQHAAAGPAATSRSRNGSTPREAADRTEVGQVAGAVNRLLDHVDAALTARQQQRDEGPPVRGRRQPRAAHPADRDPRLRRADPSDARRGARRS